MAARLQFTTLTLSCALCFARVGTLDVGAPLVYDRGAPFSFCLLRWLVT